MLVACMALLDAPIARLLDDVGPAVLAILMTLSRSGLFNFVVLPFFAALVLYDFKSMRSLHPATL
jgi:hypothetical protein